MTKFLEENDISVTKFLNNDLAVSKFLGTASTRFLETNDITVTKFLDTTVTKFLNMSDTAVTKYLEQNDVSVTKFLEAAINNFLLDTEACEQFLNLKGDYDLNITNFLDSNDLQDNKFYSFKFLESDLGDLENEISVTKFLDGPDNDISVTKFLEEDNTYKSHGYDHASGHWDDSHLDYDHEHHLTGLDIQSHDLDHVLDDHH